jgi:hypothetical protein
MHFCAASTPRSVAEVVECIASPERKAGKFSSAEYL